MSVVDIAYLVRMRRAACGVRKVVIVAVVLEGFGDESRVRR